MKNAMITWLEKHNQTTNEPITRLFFYNNGKQEFVEDYSYFANENYMSKELLEALSKGKTLTSKLDSELNLYKRDMYYYGTN
jgi:hypothetical protein